MIKSNSTILFQGDSITDAGRIYNDPKDLGPGYALKVSEYLTTFCKEKNITVLNRAISGNRVIDLQGRWQPDCLDLHPDYVSIMIGINDTWRRYDSNDPTSAEQYEQGYRDILTQCKEKLGCQLIVIEPYLLPVTPDLDLWREDLDPKIQAARRLAREFHAIYIPLDGMFAELTCHTPANTFSLDGVHPTDVGHAFIAKEWIKRVID